MKAIIGGRVLTITAGDMEQGVVLVEQGRFKPLGGTWIFRPALR